jgi:hypothetical protein
VVDIPHPAGNVFISDKLLGMWCISHKLLGMWFNSHKLLGTWIISHKLMGTWFIYHSQWKCGLSPTNCWECGVSPTKWWKCGLSLTNCHFYSNWRETQFTYPHAGLNQHDDGINSSNLFDQVFATFSGLQITCTDYSSVKSNSYFPPLVVDIHLPPKACT